MALFEGKTTTERNKIIAAGVLGLVALIALYMAFGRGLFGGSSSAAVKSSPTPRPTATPSANRDDAKLPTFSEQDFAYQTTAVEYRPGSSYAPDPGRNIFAFYEPPPPCIPGKDCPPPPTPKPTPTPIPATPAPTPAMMISMLDPGLVYAGVRQFKLEITGDRFTSDARIYFNQTEMPTTFVDGQHLTTNIPSNLIAQEGSRQVIVQTPSGLTYSNQMMLTVMAPPKPLLQYIGMIGRKRYNNDTAYFTDGSKPTPFGARLNDVVKGQFRLVDISPTEVVFEDINLGFRHRIPISQATNTGGGSPGAPPFDPTKGNIPGFPGVQPFNPAQAVPKRSPGDKGDVDDGDGGD